MGPEYEWNLPSDRLRVLGHVSSLRLSSISTTSKIDDIQIKPSVIFMSTYQSDIVAQGLADRYSSVPQRSVNFSLQGECATDAQGIRKVFGIQLCESAGSGCPT